MPFLNNITFNVKFDLTGVPKMVFTDTTDYAGEGVSLANVKGNFKITHPDGVEEENISLASPDIKYDAGGGALNTFSKNLRLAGDGQPMRGVYKFVYTVYVNDDFAGSEVRNYDYQYTPITPEITTVFDVFTPNLKIQDTTASYAKGGFSENLTRSLRAVSSGIGMDKTSVTDTLFLDMAGIYYDAEYIITLTADMIYSDDVNTWVTITDQLVTTLTKSADTPPTACQLLADLTEYKETMDALNGVNNTLYNKYLDNYLKAYSFYSHLRDRIEASDYTNPLLSDWVDEIKLLLDNFVASTYVNTNSSIPAYVFDLSTCTGGGEGVGYWIIELDNVVQ